MSPPQNPDGRTEDANGPPLRQPHRSEPDGQWSVLSKGALTKILVLAVIVALSGWIARVDPTILFNTDARMQMWSFVSEGIPPDVSREYLFGRSLRDGLFWAVIETVAISVVGIVIAVGLAIPLALTSAANVTHQGPLFARSSAPTRTAGKTVYRLSHSLASFLRSVPDLVWGFLFVTAVGLGPFAGALAIGVHNAGVLGKLYAEFLEDTDPMPAEAVYGTGATRLQTVVHAVLPQVTPTMLSYTLYRWECAIRAATILGFVGAGGIGYYLTITISRLQYPKLVTAIIAVFVLVLGADYLSARVRTSLL